MIIFLLLIKGSSQNNVCPPLYSYLALPCSQLRAIQHLFTFLFCLFAASWSQNSGRKETQQQPEVDP